MDGGGGSGDGARNADVTPEPASVAVMETLERDEPVARNPSPQSSPSRGEEADDGTSEVAVDSARGQAICHRLDVIWQNLDTNNNQCYLCFAMSTPVSLQDVARAAEVHRSTVCRILTGRADRDRICPATQSHVRSIASQLGYVRKLPILFPRKAEEVESPKSNVQSLGPVVPELTPQPPAPEPPAMVTPPPSTPVPEPEPGLESTPVLMPAPDSILDPVILSVEPSPATTVSPSGTGSGEPRPPEEEPATVTEPVPPPVVSTPEVPAPPLQVSGSEEVESPESKVQSPGPVVPELALQPPESEPPAIVTPEPVAEEVESPESNVQSPGPVVVAEPMMDSSEPVPADATTNQPEEAAPTPAMEGEQLVFDFTSLTSSGKWS